MVENIAVLCYDLNDFRDWFMNFAESNYKRLYNATYILSKGSSISLIKWTDSVSKIQKVRYYHAIAEKHHIFGFMFKSILKTKNAELNPIYDWLKEMLELRIDYQKKHTSKMEG